MEYIIYEVKDHIAYITMNRPEKLNAINATGLDELFQVFADFKENPEAWVCILTGAGDRAFVAGADINVLYDNHDKGLERSLAGQIVFRRIEQSKKPVIAAINGFALGGGDELALSAAYRVASKGAVLGQPEILLGIIPGYAGTQRLARLVGPRTAALITLSGEQLKADRAKLYGVVDEVVPDALKRAQELARAVASGKSLPPRQAVAPESLWAQAATLSFDPVVQRLVTENESRGQGDAARRIVAAISHGVALETEAGQDVEALLFGEVMATAEAERGLSDFLNKKGHKPLAMPAALPIQELPSIPETRGAWILRRDGPRGTASQALERVTLPNVDIRDDEVQIEVLASPAEANAGRWLPEGRPIDIPKVHGQPYHVPGNIAVGRIVARGALVPNLPHLWLGALVVTNNTATDNPLDPRLLRGDADMPMKVAGYDSFGFDPASPMRRGTHATYAAVHYAEVMPKPEQLTLEQAAAYPLPDPTIWHNNRRVQLGRGDTLLLIGARGSTGGRGIQIDQVLEEIEAAEFIGVRRIIGVVSNEEKKRQIEAESKPAKNFEVVGINRTEFERVVGHDESGTPIVELDTERFVQRVIELNGGQPVDVALDFMGDAYPNAFVKAVKTGNAADGVKGVGRMTWYGAELSALAVPYKPSIVEGVAGTASVETMFKAVEDVRDLPDTDKIVDAAVHIHGDTPEVRAAMASAKANAKTDRAIKRVLTYGVDVQTIYTLLAAANRRAKVAVIVKDADDVTRLQGALGSLAINGIIVLADHLTPDGKIDDRKLGAAVKAALGDKPDVIVERANSAEVLGLPEGTQTLRMSYSYGFLRAGGQVIFTEDTSGQKFSLDMRTWVAQMDILFPTKFMISSHYASQTESWLANEAVRKGTVAVAEPTVMSFDEIPRGLDSQGDGKIVFLHDVPSGLRTQEEVTLARQPAANPVLSHTFWTEFANRDPDEQWSALQGQEAELGGEVTDALAQLTMADTIEKIHALTSPFALPSDTMEQAKWAEQFAAIGFDPSDPTATAKLAVDPANPKTVLLHESFFRGSPAGAIKLQRFLEWVRQIGGFASLEEAVQSGAIKLALDVRPDVEEMVGGDSSVTKVTIEIPQGGLEAVEALATEVRSRFAALSVVATPHADASGHVGAATFFLSAPHSKTTQMDDAVNFLTVERLLISLNKALNGAAQMQRSWFTVHPNKPTTPFAAAIGPSEWLKALEATVKVTLDAAESGQVRSEAAAFDASIAALAAGQQKPPTPVAAKLDVEFDEASGMVIVTPTAVLPNKAKELEAYQTELAVTGGSV